MSFSTYIPTEILKPFINKYLIIESEDELVNRILPDTSLTVVFRFQGEVKYVNKDEVSKLPGSVISGLRKSVRLINYLKGSAALIIRFKETGARAFFKQPLHELFEQSVSLDNFIQKEKIAGIEGRLAEAKNNDHRIAIIEELLLSIIYDIHDDKLISTAVQKIHNTKGNIKIKELADTLYVSHDAFEKRFRKTVGTTPKQFSSIIRMKAVIQNMQQKQTFTDIAYDAGFFDQPHFNKEFKLFTGQPPADFFKSPSFW